MSAHLQAIPSQADLEALATRVAGATPVQVPLTDGRVHDLPAMADAITDRTRLIFVCNPNNPTCTVVDADALEAFLARVPSDVLVALDEAYIEALARRLMLE